MVDRAPAGRPAGAGRADGPLIPDAPTLHRLVEAALSAPSGDNCQPWRFGWDGRTLRVRFVPDRAASLYDVRDLASCVALGALLLNLRLAARSHRLSPAVELFPAGEEVGVVARVRFAPAETGPDELADAIARRCVNRWPYRRGPLPEPVRRALVAEAQSVAGVHLAWREGPPMDPVASLAAANDRLLFENRPLHDGLYRWLRWSPQDVAATRDGMPIGTLGLHRLEYPGFRLLGRWGVARLAATVGLTRALPLRSRLVYRRSAAIGLVSVARPERQLFVQAGEAIQRLWLRATSLGVAFQPITGVTFLLLRLRLGEDAELANPHRAAIERLGRRLDELIPEARGLTPVMLFRVGLARPPAERAPRLDVGAVLETSSARPA